MKIYIPLRAPKYYTLCNSRIICSSGYFKNDFPVNQIVTRIEERIEAIIIFNKTPITQVDSVDDIQHR